MIMWTDVPDVWGVVGVYRDDVDFEASVDGCCFVECKMGMSEWWRRILEVPLLEVKEMMDKWSVNNLTLISFSKKSFITPRLMTYIRCNSDFKMYDYLLHESKKFKQYARYLPSVSKFIALRC